MKPSTSPDIAASRAKSAKRVCVLDAAASVFCREGFGGANIDLIAVEAGVSRQTIYNHHGDKENLFVAVVQEVTDRTNAGIFETLDTFPDHPTDLEGELVAFAVRLNRNCICNRDGKFLRKLIQSEGERYPELFAAWRQHGQGRIGKALAARLARLAHAGLLDIDDPDLAARQFLALVNVDTQMAGLFGDALDDEQLARSAAGAVRTFLRAFAKRQAP